ncbi:MAG: DNA/RNA non-specific endonuclease [Flavobacteriales bacterium]|nr:DNA/RNA non-specific endonuclease [Flavobacteriales bacterium]
MRTTFIFALAIFSFFSGLAQERPEIYCKHFFYGYPYGTPASNDLIIRDIYAMSNNDATKFADWVAYRLTMHEVDGDLEVERNWREDPWLADDETLEPSPSSKDDYKDASSTLDVDRGHQAPLASFKGSRFASQSNLLSNITPQKKDLNQGPWKNLEEAVRDLVRTGKTVHVMTGPIYNESMPKLPNADEDHKIPSAYWKVVIAITGDNSFETAAFIMHQNSGRTDALASKVVTIDEVEKQSGLDLLWELPDAEENSVESKKNTAWISTWVK